MTLAPDMEGKGKEGKGKGVDVGASLESPPAPVPKTSRRGTRIPDDFGVTPELEDFCVMNTLPDPHVEMPKLIAYFRTAPGSKGLKLEWPLVAQTWMRNAKDRHRQAPWSSGEAYYAARKRCGMLGPQIYTTGHAERPVDPSQAPTDADIAALEGMFAANLRAS